ncbi:MAG: zinc ribbon domain-containing protein [Acidobacteriota bacterium]|nr:zinc ribbon domain-containing protein [Acidobacteriota bacterium]
MFCPRCGSANNETIKYCRQCGLPLAQVGNFVSTGGTGALVSSPQINTMNTVQQQPPVPIQLAETSEMLALKQKRILTIMAMILLPILLAIVGEEMANAGEVFAATFLLIPLGVTWAVYHYKTQLRRLQEKQLQQHFAVQQPMYQQPPQAAPMPQPMFQGQLSPPPTNPLNVANSAPNSVVEEETRKFHSNQ